MKIAIINGPNLNMLGIREPDIYGKATLRDLEKLLEVTAAELGHKLVFFQSNHEGAIIDYIQSLYNDCDGIIINPGAYSHTSIAILDALKSVAIETIEVHLSDLATREDFRKHSYVSLYAKLTITGKGFEGYIQALNNISII